MKKGTILKNRRYRFIREPETLDEEVFRVLANYKGTGKVLKVGLEEKHTHPLTEGEVPRR